MATRLSAAPAERRRSFHGVSAAMRRLMDEAPAHAYAWLEATSGLEQASALDAKTSALAGAAVAAALGLEDAIGEKAVVARRAGASRRELISAVLLGLPAAGARVVESLPAALDAFDRA